jgi:cell division protein FtsW (lipid II flippase)
VTLVIGGRIREIIGRDLTPAHAGWLCVASGVALSLLGIYAIDVALVGDRASDVPVSPTGMVLRQIIFLAVGLASAAVVALPHYRFVRYVAWPSMWVVLGLLVFLLIPAVPSWIVTPRNGARAWITLGPLTLQPAELAKISFIMVLADYLRWRKNHRTLTGLIPPAVIGFVPVALIMLQPDLGSASLFAPTLLAMLLAAGAKMKHLVAAVLIAAAALPLSFPLLRPHQQQRIIGLISVVRGEATGAEDINYQQLTAVTLAGAGGVDGRGDEKSRALVKFNRLPERHNDMVFAVIVNRFGLVGGLAVLALYGVWVLGALMVAGMSREPFGRLVVVGCAAIVSVQMFVNVGMNLGYLPIVGLTLPFVSYGGSSMVTVWIMTGLIVNVGMRKPPRLARPSFEFDE